MSDEIEARKKAAEKGWLGEPQPERERQYGIWTRKAIARERLLTAAANSGNLDRVNTDLPEEDDDARS